MFPTHKDNTLFGKLLFIHWANQRLKCKDFHHSLFFIFMLQEDLEIDTFFVMLWC